MTAKLRSLGPTAAARRVGTAATIAAGTVVLWAVSGGGAANYDTLYALAWGQQAARGETPQYGIAIAPTPHPLAEALGFVASPLGPHAMERVAVWLGFVAVAICGWAVYRLGSLWFNRAAGAVAAALFVTRVPVLSYGVRAYADLPYLALLLGALVVETRRPRAGAPVLALLAVAGLLRPEAWAFSALYWIYLFDPLRARARARTRRTAKKYNATPAPGASKKYNTTPAPGAAKNDDNPPAPEPRREYAKPDLIRLAVLAAAAPAVWIVSDLAITGDAMWSLVNTRHTAAVLGRKTGIGDVPEYIPRRIGEVLGAAGLAGAAIGGLLALVWTRERARIGAIAGTAAVAVFAAFATAGLPIVTRYAFGASAILCIFCGAAVFGWTTLETGHPGRRRWQAAAVLVAAGLAASIPGQYRTNADELASLEERAHVQHDLERLAENGAIAKSCEPIGVPNHTPIPVIALWLKTPPSEVVSARQRTITHGTWIEPADEKTRENYILDKEDRESTNPEAVPNGFKETEDDGTWRIFQRCAEPGR
jgi:hypothetical protein